MLAMNPQALLDPSTLMSHPAALVGGLGAIGTSCLGEQLHLCIRKSLVLAMYGNVLGFAVLPLVRQAVCCLVAQQVSHTAKDSDNSAMCSRIYH